MLTPFPSYPHPVSSAPTLSGEQESRRRWEEGAGYPGTSRATLYGKGGAGGAVEFRPPLLEGRSISGRRAASARWVPPRSFLSSTFPDSGDARLGGGGGSWALGLGGLSRPEEPPGFPAPAGWEGPGGVEAGRVGPSVASWRG